MAVVNNSQYKKKAIIQLILRLIGSELIGISFAFFYVAAKTPLGVMSNIIFGFSSAACMLCLLADMCLKLGGKIKGNVTLHNEKPMPLFGLLLGVLSTLPYYVSYVVLLLAKFRVIGSFTGPFKLINAYFLPVIDSFAKGSTASADIYWPSMILFALLPLTMIAVCHFCYKISYENIDIAKKVLYKK